MFAALIHQGFKKTNSAFQLLPSFLLETRSREMQGTQKPHHHYYNFTLSSAQVPPLPLLSLSELNVPIIFPKHPTGKRRGLCQNHESWQMREEKQNLSLIPSCGLPAGLVPLSSCFSVMSSPNIYAF